MSESESGGKGPLAEMSDQMAEETDIYPDNASVVVTSGPQVEGNEIMVVLHRDDESDEDDVIVGFEGRGRFDEILSKKLLSATNRPILELSDEEVEALDDLIEAGAWELPHGQERVVRNLQDRLPEVDLDA